MSRARGWSAALGAWLACGWFAPAAPAGLDWEPQESPDPPPALRALRNLRDGALTFPDAFLDANTAGFGSACLLISQLLMASSDLIGLLDDNPASEHLTRGLVSGALARTAYLWHVAGAESLLGGHGLEKARWLTPQVATLNPLLGEADVAELAGPLPLDPLEFVEEGMLHPRVYRPHAIPIQLIAVVLVDGAARPAAGALRMLQLPAAGDALEQRASSWFERALRMGG
jgi:hypothetical protein